MLKRIHVNQHNIKSNLKHGTQLPVVTVKTHNENWKGNRVEIQGPSIVRYADDNPLSCGARVWVETHAEVIVE